MTTKVLCTHGPAVVAYLPNLRSVVRHFRAFSSYGSHRASDLHAGDPASLSGHPDSRTIWPDSHLGPFAPKDRRFLLPGLVGVSIDILAQDWQTLLSPERPRPFADPVNALPQTDTERHINILDQVISQAATEDSYSPSEDTVTMDDLLECVAQKCPSIIKKDFQDLFPSRRLDDIDVTVITLSHHTTHDMISWSPAVEEERELLLDMFVKGAQEICTALNDAGYWADFIDPSSGRPFYGPYTNATFFETDERYRKLGFEIEDLGCCKVISHHLWGTHAYIGCLFTNAPLEHPIIQQMKNNEKT